MACKEKLTDRAIKAALKTAVAEGRESKLNDGGGLVLMVKTSGAAWWRIRYSFAGKEKMLSLGTYPDTSLADARARRDAMRAQLTGGADPSAQRRLRKAELAKHAEEERLAEAGLPAQGSFEQLARRWHAVRAPEWADNYSSKVIQRLENKVFPFVGRRAIGDLQPPDWLVVLRKCESDGKVETAHRVRDTCSQVYKFAIAEGVAFTDPLRDLAVALRAHTTQHIPAVTDPTAFGELLKAIDSYWGMPTVKAALKLLSLVFLRPGNELRMARWEEFNLDEAVWTVPAARLKRGKDGKKNGPPHIVPLSRQAVEELRALHQLTGDGQFAFRGRSRKSQPISENTINQALTSLGFDGSLHRAHGFRASARTMIAERLKFDPAVIEHQLAHSVPDANGTAYNRTKFLEDRREMMQHWADYVDQLKLPVVPLRLAA